MKPKPPRRRSIDYLASMIDKRYNLDDGYDVHEVSYDASTGELKFSDDIYGEPEPLFQRHYQDPYCFTKHLRKLK